MVQRLEKHLRKALEKHDGLWIRKLRITGYANDDAPADFLILGPNNNILIECKECAGTRFDFSRWTQANAMLNFSTYKRNHSFVALSFWRGNYKKSLYFLLPAGALMSYIEHTTKASINLNELNAFFNNCAFSLVEMANAIYKESAL